MLKLAESNNTQTKPHKKLLIFGGSPSRMKEVKLFLSQIKDIEIIGAFSEEEGVQIFKGTKDIDLVLIGGAYTSRQRLRIKELVGNTKVTEPGVAYPYSNENIFLHVKNSLLVS